MAYQQYTPQVPRTPKEAKVSQVGSRRNSLGCGVVLLAMSLLIGIPLLATGAWGVGFVVVPFFGVGLAMIIYGLAPALRAVKVDDPDIQFSADTLPVGDSFEVSYRQHFKAPLTVDFAKMTLLMRETATYQRGTNTYTEKHEIVAEKFDLPGRVYQAGETLEFAHRFAIPPNAMHTFIARHNRIEWIVQIHVSIAQWPDFQEEYPISVRAHSAGPMRMEDR